MQFISLILFFQTSIYFQNQADTLSWLKIFLFNFLVWFQHTDLSLFCLLSSLVFWNSVSLSHPRLYSMLILLPKMNSSVLFLLQIPVSKHFFYEAAHCLTKFVIIIIIISHEKLDAALYDPRCHKLQDNCHWFGLS